MRWIYRIFTIKGEELKLKCGLDGYFFIRFIRAMIIIFAPLMVIVVTVLLPINYNGGKDDNVLTVGHKRVPYNVTGLDTLSWVGKQIERRRCQEASYADCLHSKTWRQPKQTGTGRTWFAHFWP